MANILNFIVSRPIVLYLQSPLLTHLTNINTSCKVWPFSSQLLLTSSILIYRPLKPFITLILVLSQPEVILQYAAYNADNNVLIFDGYIMSKIKITSSSNTVVPDMTLVNAGSWT